MPPSPSQHKFKNLSSIKIAIQLSAFALIAAFAWFYLDKKTQNSSNQPTTFKVLSDDELTAVVQTLVMDESILPKDPRTIAMARLGRDFFFDPAFSANGQVSCASCHKPELSFTDGKQFSEGISKTKMNAPTLVNVQRGHWFFWNGRADSLESQAVGPLEHPGEHGFSRFEIVNHLREHYKVPYEKLFGPLPIIRSGREHSFTKNAKPLVSDEIAAYALTTLGDSDVQKRVLASARDQGVQPIEIIKNYAAFETDKRPSNLVQSAQINASQDELRDINKVLMNFTRAVAAFERTIHASDSPFDRFAKSLVETKNTKSALNNEFGDTELRGLRVFTGKGQCLVCHVGPTLSDEQFHNIGLDAAAKNSIDLGRAQGMLLARSDPFNCSGDYLPEKKQTESCLELGYLETENIGSVGAFKTPTLRQLKHTAPYGHDGRFASLSDVLRHYNELETTPAVGRTEATLRPLGLSDGELKDLERFLLSLHGTTTYLQQ